MKSLAFAVSAAALVSLAACQPATAPKAEAKQPPALPADVQAVAGAIAPETTPLPAARVSDDFTGEFVSPVRSELVAKVPGRVGAVFVDEGARVRRGQPLLQLETDYLALDEKRAQSEVERTRAAADESRRDFERKRGLLEKESVAQAVYERSRAQWEQADAAQRSAVTAFDVAKQRLADAVLVSPIDGVVVERRADVGERLGDNTIAFVLQQTAPLKLRFRVPERYLAQAQLGQAVKARVDPYPDQVFSGRIAVLGHSIDPTTRTFFVEAEFPNADGKLRPGLFARVEAALGGGAE